jgi:hypothetical protein
MTDKERLDFLEWLLTRTEFQNQRVPARTVSSDMHFGPGHCNLFVRNMFGNPVLGGHGTARSVREAIDTVADRMGPNADLSGRTRSA